MQVHNKTFTSIKEMKYYTSDIVRRLGACLITKEDHEFNYFNELIKRHYRYTPDYDISHFRIDYNKMTKRNDQMSVIFNNNTSEIFSYIKCCTKAKTNTDDLLTRAMRYHIQDHILEYRKNVTDAKCNVCNSLINLQVDHIIQFQQIRDYFIAHTKYNNLMHLMTLGIILL